MRTWQYSLNLPEETNIDETSGVNYMEIPAQHILKYGTVSELNGYYQIPFPSLNFPVLGFMYKGVGVC